MDVAADIELLGAVGSSPRRLDIVGKVTGRALYIDDLTRPNMLHGAIVQSPYPHARILGYELSEALALPGVVCVLTGKELGHHRFGPMIKDETVLPREKVRYVGEPVAIIAAESERIARAAARLVQVRYEELPAVLSIDDALAEGAPILHEDSAQYFRLFPTECGGNIAWTTVLNEGDVDAAWANCDVIVEGEFETQAQAHVAMEPCGALAEVDGNGRVTLWSSNQGVHVVQAEVCEGLGLPMSRLCSKVPMVGGAFGAKIEIHVQSFVVALAIETQRPVKMVLAREEDFEVNRLRHPFRIRTRTGAKRDGTLVAREVDAIVDGGAYGDESPGVMGFAMFMARGPYRIPHSRARGRVVYTNKLRFGAFRGYGNPQVSFATETQLDELAAKLGMDPIDLRLKNALRKGDLWTGGGEIHSSGFIRCLEAVRDAAKWRKRTTLKPRPGWQRGLGLGCSSHISGLLSASAVIRILEDGSIALNTGAVDIGQGSETALVQIVAGALKVPIDRVAVATPDTDGSPYNWITAASRVTYMVGRAVIATARDIEAQLKGHASEIFECPIEDLELLPGGRVGVIGSPDKEIGFRELSLRAHFIRGGPIIASRSQIYDKLAVDPKRTVAHGVPFPQIGAFSFAAMVCDLEVEEATGKVVVHEVWSACDVGKAINRRAVEGQIEGGFVQGLGFALFEEVVWDGARMANPTLMDYKIPTCLDAPYLIHPLIIEEPEPDGPFGAKGIGEIPICPVAAAIANGIAAATAGLRLRKLPLTAERVLLGMLQNESSTPHDNQQLPSKR